MENTNSSDVVGSYQGEVEIPTLDFSQKKSEK